MYAFLFMTFWFLLQLIFQMVGVIDHVKHVTADQSSQAKRLQIGQKNVEGAKVVAKKALEEANARISIMEAKLGVLFVEKDVTNQALTMRKLARLMLSLSWSMRKNVRQGSQTSLL